MTSHSATAFVALVRGVNVGKGNRLPMADFRALLQRLGYIDVRTILNSGNAVFISANPNGFSHARLIQAALESTLKLLVPVIVKSAAEIRAIVIENELVDEAADLSKLLTIFIQDPQDLPSLAALKPLAKANERFQIGAHAAYLDCAEGLLQSKLAEALLKGAGKAVTTRNWATVLKLQAMLNS